MTAFFSVIIPTLNEENYLPHLLSCLKDQLFREFEVIIVDGCSEDKTVQAAKKFQKMLPKLTILTSKKKNVSFQRNMGAQEAKGNYFVFFDADVGIPNDFLQKLHSHIIKTGDVLLTTNLLPDEKTWKKIAITTVANIGREILLKCNQPSVGGYNIIVDRNFFQIIGGFDIHCVHGEDVRFLQDAGKKGNKIKNLSDPQQYYSFRRFDRYGYMVSIAQFFSLTAHMFLGSDLKKNQIVYPMGGNTYQNKTKKV